YENHFGYGELDRIEQYIPIGHITDDTGGVTDVLWRGSHNIEKRRLHSDGTDGRHGYRHDRHGIRGDDFYDSNACLQRARTDQPDGAKRPWCPRYHVTGAQDGRLQA